jgi:hypothetical protein
MSTLSQFFGSDNVTNNVIKTTVVSSLPGIASTSIEFQPYTDLESDFLQLTPFNSSYTFSSYSCCPRKYSYEGGFLICSISNLAWIVAPNTSQVSRTWYGRNDANTTAQQVSGCTGWFVPTITQLSNPGYTCRKFWDSFSSTAYWSSTEQNADCAILLNFPNNTSPANCFKTNTFCVRAFRCVTY